MHAFVKLVIYPLRGIIKHYCIAMFVVKELNSEEAKNPVFVRDVV